MRRTLFVLARFVLCGGIALAQEVHVRPSMSYVAAITEPVLIEQVLRQQSIPLETHTDSIEIIDAMANGFGENDLLVLYPSKQVFALMNIEEPLKTMMDNWHYNLEQRTTPYTTSTELAKQTREERNPFDGLLTYVLRGIEQFYGGSGIEGTFRRDENSSYLALWNFAPDSFRYRDARGGGVSDTLRYYDLLNIVSHDTTYLADSTLYDVIYVYKTYRDTVYLPADSNHRAP
jgi:hypothetical protein